MKLNFLSRREPKDERLAERIAAATTQPAHTPQPPAQAEPSRPRAGFAAQPRLTQDPPPRAGAAAGGSTLIDPAKLSSSALVKAPGQPRPGAEARRNAPPQVDDVREHSPAPAPQAYAPPPPPPPVSYAPPSVNTAPPAGPFAPPPPAYSSAPSYAPPPAPSYAPPVAAPQSAPTYTQSPAADVRRGPVAFDITAGPDPRDILTSIGEVVYDWDIEGDAIVWGPNFEAAVGVCTAEDASTSIGYANFLAPQSATSRYDVIKAGGSDTGAGVPYQIQYGLLPRGRGAVVWVEDSGRWFVGSHGKPARAHGLVRVITERYEAEKQLAFRSHYDPLTGALNRGRLVEHLGRAFTAEQRDRAGFCVVLCGIDNLFAINRNYGYDIADELIAGVAERLRQSMRSHDVIARYAGNKFAMVLHSCDGEQMEIAARRFLSAVCDAPIDTSSGPVPVGLRMGGVVCPRQGRTPQAVLQHAEEALDLARKPSSNRFVVYEQSMVRDDARMRALLVADEIVTSLNQGRISIALQPVAHAKSGETAFMEALVRLQREDGTLAQPETILPVAEKAGLIHLVDHRVLELTVAELAADPNLRIAMNCSGATVHDSEWTQRLNAICSVHPGVAERLTIEITETIAIEDIEATRRIVAAMKECGVKVAIDDFGAGHTSFRNLRSLGVDLLKIDGAFMVNLANSADDRFFVRTLIELARHLQIPTVAEWVETEDMAKMLAEWGVDYLQGHYYGVATLVAPRDKGETQAVA
mgnify:CR=1 FL=1